MSTPDKREEPQDDATPQDAANLPATTDQDKDAAPEKKAKRLSFAFPKVQGPKLKVPNPFSNPRDEAAKAVFDLLAQDVIDREKISTLLNSDLNLNKRDKQGKTILMRLIEENLDDLAIATIDKGVKLGARDKEGATALHIAVENKKTGLVDVLLARKAPVNIATKQGVTALMIAAATGQTHIMNGLIRRGAGVNKKTKDNVTALMGACENVHEEAVSILLKKGAHTNVQTKSRGKTALMIAAAAGSATIAGKLIHKGARRHTRDNDEKTAYEHAHDNGHEAVCKELTKNRFWFFGQKPPLFAAEVRRRREAQAKKVMMIGARNRDNDDGGPILPLGM